MSNAMQSGAGAALLFVMVAAFAPRPGVVSSSAGECGLQDSTAVDGVASYFLGPEQETFRDSLGILEIAPTDTQAVITDTSVCRKVVREVERWINGQPLEDNIDANGWEYSVYEMGPYKTLLFRVLPGPGQTDSFPPPPGLTPATHSWVLMIYEQSGNQLTFKGAGLV